MRYGRLSVRVEPLTVTVTVSCAETTEASNTRPPGPASMRRKVAVMTLISARVSTAVSRCIALLAVVGRVIY
jgi:hypothetical protein